MRVRASVWGKRGSKCDSRRPQSLVIPLKALPMCSGGAAVGSSSDGVNSAACPVRTELNPAGWPAGGWIMDLRNEIFQFAPRGIAILAYSHRRRPPRPFDSAKELSISRSLSLSLVGYRCPPRRWMGFNNIVVASLRYFSDELPVGRVQGLCVWV